MLSWLKALGSKQAHVCMEATGRHSLGVALALYDAGHIVSVVNPAQIRDFARAKLGRNKTDKVDAALIGDYAALFNPAPWTPPSPAMRRLCELHTVRAGIIGSRTEWKNCLGSGLGDSTATGLAAMTIEHFTHQLETIDRAIGETIDQDAALRGRRDLLLSVSGVGETLAALLLVEMPSPEVLRRSGEMVAYAGLNPSHHRSGSSIDRPTRISRYRQCHSAIFALYASAVRDALQSRRRSSCRAPQGSGPPQAQTDRCSGNAQASGHMFRCPEDRQAVRSGDRHASLNRNDFPYSVVRLETDHSAVPICQHVSRRAQRWSRRAADPRTAVRLVLDGSEHADTLSHIRGCQNQHPALDRPTRYLPRLLNLLPTGSRPISTQTV